MPYTVRSDIDDRIGLDELIQLTDINGTGTVDVVAIELAMADADAEIDGYLAGRYILPLVVIPANLVRIAVDIVRYRLWNDRASDEVRQRYQDAVRYLEQVARGVITLPPDAQGAATPVATGFAYSSPTLSMTDDTLGFM